MRYTGNVLGRDEVEDLGEGVLMTVKPRVTQQTVYLLDEPRL